MDWIQVGLLVVAIIGIGIQLNNSRKQSETSGEKQIKKLIPKIRAQSGIIAKQVSDIERIDPDRINEKKQAQNTVDSRIEKILREIL